MFVSTGARTFDPPATRRPGSTDPRTTCTAWMREACNVDSRQQNSALLFEFTRKTFHDPFPLPAVVEDVAMFLLSRGPFAWLGHNWMGCTSIPPMSCLAAAHFSRALFCLCVCVFLCICLGLCHCYCIQTVTKHQHTMLSTHAHLSWRAHTRTHARARTHARTHAHTHITSHHTSGFGEYFAPNATAIRPAQVDVDYGTPIDTACKETSAGSAIFTREYSKASVEMDCNSFSGKVNMH